MFFQVVNRTVTRMIAATIHVHTTEFEIGSGPM
jgi:hypothetical protein